MKAPKLDHLSTEDAEILGLESGAIAGHTLKVLVTERPESSGDLLEEVRQRVAVGVAKVPRCAQRLAPTPFGVAPPAWVADADFDVHAHVRRVPAAGLVSHDRFLELVAGSMAERLDRRRPLWTVDLVEGLEGDRVAYLLKVHHCMADGTASLRLGSALLWGDPLERRADADVGFPQDGPPGRVALLASGVRERVRSGCLTAADIARAITSPSQWRSEESRLAGTFAAVRRELLPASTRTPLDASIGRARSVAFVTSRLEDLKRVSHSRSATVNDVLLTAVAGGLRDWLMARGEQLPAMRVKVPVSMHRVDEGPAALGNRDSFFFVDLPLTEPEPLRRLEAVRQETAQRKRDHDADALYVLFNDLSHVSHRVYRRANQFVGRPGVFSLCVSNMPGPPERLDVLGGAVKELHSLAEVGDRHGLRISALSYAGTVSLGLCADSAAVPDLDVLAAALGRATEALRAT